MNLFNEEIEEAEFFNTDDEQFSADDIKIDEIINERNGLKESYKGYIAYIGLLNTKPVFNESKNIDKVVISSNCFSENFEEAKDMIIIAVNLEGVAFNFLFDYAISDYKNFDSKLISKVNARKESANLVVSQYIDAILCESPLGKPVNAKVYSIFKGNRFAYNDMKTNDMIDNIVNNNNDITFNESCDFYFNGFKRREWL